MKDRFSCMNARRFVIAEERRRVALRTGSAGSLGASIAPRIELLRKGEKVYDENFAKVIASDDLAIVDDERAFRQSRSR
jgi:hypothetical protein